MFRPSHYGLGNLLIWLSQLDDVTPVCFKTTNISKYIQFKNLNIVEDDITKENIDLPICINPYTIKHVHPNICEKMEPTDIMKQLIDKNQHLVQGVDFAIHVRRGVDGYFDRFADDSALNQFDDLISKSSSVFLASDCEEFKRKMKDKHGEKVKYYNHHTGFVHTTDLHNFDDYASILDFFLLSMCPMVYITGGPVNMTGFSTFGYMASIYGKKPFNVIWNAPSV